MNTNKITFGACLHYYFMFNKQNSTIQNPIFHCLNINRRNIYNSWIYQADNFSGTGVSSNRYPIYSTPINLEKNHLKLSDIVSHPSSFANFLSTRGASAAACSRLMCPTCCPKTLSTLIALQS